MIATLLTTLALTSTPPDPPDLESLVRTTLERCFSGREVAVAFVPDLADADHAQPFRSEHLCGVTASGWIGDDGALVAAARAAVGADGTDWVGPVRETRVNESGPSLWTEIQQAEGWNPASLLVIEPPPGQRGHVEILFDPVG